MFSKMKAKPTLAETYGEAERIEAEKESIEDYPGMTCNFVYFKRIKCFNVIAMVFS